MHSERTPAQHAGLPPRAPIEDPAGTRRERRRTSIRHLAPARWSWTRSAFETYGYRVKPWSKRANLRSVGLGRCARQVSGTGRPPLPGARHPGAIESDGSAAPPSPRRHVRTQPDVALRPGHPRRSPGALAMSPREADTPSATLTAPGDDRHALTPAAPARGLRRVPGAATDVMTPARHSPGSTRLPPSSPTRGARRQCLSAPPSSLLRVRPPCRERGRRPVRP